MRHGGRRRAGQGTQAPRALRVLVAGVAAGALVVAAGVPRVHAATYKWVDENGVVHYTDHIPPEAVNKGSVELSKQAIPLKKTDPTLTPEQRRAKAEEDARQRELAKQRELVERRDRALLATYTVESEIDLARSRALATIEEQVRSATAYAATLGKRKAEVEAKVQALGNKPVPPVVERELANVNAELAKQDDLMAAKQKEILAVNAKYDADKKRWKELRAATEAQVNGTARPGATAASAAPAPAANPAAVAAPAPHPTTARQ